MNQQLINLIIFYIERLYTKTSQKIITTSKGKHRSLVVIIM